MTAANTHIKRKAENLAESLDSLASRKHVRGLATTLDRSLAKNQIQAAQLTELQHIVSTQKERQSGKHKILRGETVIAIPKMLSIVEETENLTQKSKIPNLRQLTPPPQNIDPSLSLTYIESKSNYDGILDCIIVAHT
jgi:hypothetical protein